MSLLRAFVFESNRIEGIDQRPPTDAEVEATENFLLLPAIGIADMKRLVSVFQPDAVIRDRPTLNVRVGDHVAPQGGPQILAGLDALLNVANTHRGAVKGWEGAYAVHARYETLHPFTDGNGRSGRALWLWQMRGHAPLGFLHTWYYQSLQNSRISSSTEHKHG